MKILSKFLTDISETISSWSDDVALAADSMRPVDWAVFIVAGILEVAFVITVIVLVSAY
jgi:hypothetical protein